MCLYSIEYERCGRLLPMGRRYLEEQDGNSGDLRYTQALQRCLLDRYENPKSVVPTMQNKGELVITPIFPQIMPTSLNHPKSQTNEGGSG